MPPTKGVRKAPSKLCLRCNRILPLTNFYVHKDWREQVYRDAWCKECAGKYCKDKESLKGYCFENNRRWEDQYFDSAMKKAQYSLATNPDYLASSTEEKR